jgi:hypothetical protein
MTRSAKLFWAGLVTLNLGTAPLLFYVLTGPHDGRLISTGLLAALWLSWVVGVVLLLGAAANFMRSEAAHHAKRAGA